MEKDDNKSVCANEIKEKELKKAPRKRHRKRRTYVWLICLTFLAIFVALVIGFVSEAFLGTNSIPVCIAIILVLLLVAFFGDIIAMAAISGDITHFNSMASRRIKGAKICVKLVKNGDRVASVLSDVLGDVTAIVSGSVGASLAFVILDNTTMHSTLQALTIASVAAVISGIAILAKALAKMIGIKNSTRVIYATGRFLSFFQRKKNK